MLLRFSVSNFGSLRDEQELSLVASTLRDDDRGLIDVPELKSVKVLPSVVIYGANASGKSNVLRALSHMKELVRNSHREGEPGSPISLKPFLLDPSCSAKPTTFGIDFLWNGARYAYSFEANRSQFTEEALHVWRGGPVTLLFERKGQTFKFGRSLKGRNKIIEDLTRPNSLFLSSAAQNNHEELTAIAEFFNSIAFELATPMTAAFVSGRLAREGVDDKLLGFFHEIDTGITTTRIDEAPLEQSDIEFRESLIGAFQKLLGGPPPLELKSSVMEPMRWIRFGHQTTDGQTVFLDMSDESAGTVQLLQILGPIFRALDSGQIAVIDEFGSRLHTRTSEIILGLFASKETNSKGAQLIVATHDTNLLNAAKLRRDQVWFTEKDKAGATHLYPLTDIVTRKDDNLEKGYLQGRYGAIPFAGSRSDLTKTD